MKKSGTLSFKSDGPCPRAHPWKALKTRKYLFYLESMHLQWTEYFAKLFTGIKKGAHAGGSVQKPSTIVDPIRQKTLGRIFVIPGPLPPLAIQC